MHIVSLFLSIIYATATHLNINPINKYMFSNIDRVNFLFNIIDNNPKDGYLYYNELYIFQKQTEPKQQLELTPNIYIQLCILFGANQQTGLTLAEFNSSYYQYSYQLGTDLDKDFEIYNAIYKHYIQHNS